MNQNDQDQLQREIEHAAKLRLYVAEEGYESSEKNGYAQMHAEEVLRRVIRSDSMRIIPAIGHDRIKIFVDDYGASALSELDVRISPPVNSQTAALSRYNLRVYNHEVKAEEHDPNESLSHAVGGFDRFLDLITELKVKLLPLKPPETEIKLQR